MPVAASVSLSNVQELARLQETLESVCAQRGVPGDAQIEVATALEEVVVNSFKHGHASEVSVAIQLDGGELVLELRDDAPAFNPLDVPPPDLGAPLAERPIGGLGVHLVKNLTDAQDYRREGGKNVLVLRKRY